MPIIERQGGWMSGIQFPASEVNEIIRTQYIDDFEAYQRMFNIYNYMPLTRLFDYKIHSVSAHPFMWQKLNACTFDTLGKVQTNVDTVSPCKTYMRVAMCWDELFDSCYKHLLDVSNLEIDNSLLAPITDTILSKAIEGLRMTLTMGQVFDVDSVTQREQIGDAADDETWAAFLATHDTCKGWVKLLGDLADMGYTWLNHAGLIDSSNLDGEDFATGNGEVLALYDELKDRGPKQVTRLVNRGNVQGQGMQAIFAVSDSIHAAVVKEYTRQRTQAALNEGGRISRESVNGMFIYYIDGAIPVVPISDISTLDDIVNGTTHFAAIMATGVIQLGTSFGPIEGVDGDIGLIVERQNSITDGNLGKYFWQGHGLLATAIADKNFISATRAFAPAA